jgi:hypothetical protein
MMDGRRNEVRFPVEARELSLLDSIQTGSEAQPASYPMGFGSSFPEGNATGT